VLSASKKQRAQITSATDQIVAHSDHAFVWSCAKAVALLWLRAFTERFSEENARFRGAHPSSGVVPGVPPGTSRLAQRQMRQPILILDKKMSPTSAQALSGGDARQSHPRTGVLPEPGVTAPR
jgi:hypothetical protein